MQIFCLLLRESDEIIADKQCCERLEIYGNGLSPRLYHFGTKKEVRKMGQ